MTDILTLVAGIALCVLALSLRHLIVNGVISVRLRQAELMAGQGREIDRAIRYFSTVLSLDRTNVRANWALANIYFKSKQYVLSRMYLSDISRHGRYTDAATEEAVHEMLADIFALLGDFGKATAEYLILRKRSRLPASVLKKAIRMDLQCGRMKEAAQFLSEGLKNFPDDGEFHYLSALDSFLMGDMPSAESKIITALRLGHLTDELELLSAKIAFIRQNFQEALEHLQRLPPQFLDSAEVENMMGQCFFFLKDYRPAIGVLEKLIPGLEKNAKKMLPDAMFFLGCSHEANGDLATATRIWQDILERFPYYQKAGQKLHFYSHVALSPKLQRLIVCGQAEFHNSCLELLDRLGYSVKQHYQSSDKSIDFVCTNRKDLHPYHTSLISVNRQTSAVSNDVIAQLMRQGNHLRVRYLVMIAPWFMPDTLAFCQRNLVTARDFGIFIETKESGESKSTPL